MTIPETVTISLETYSEMKNKIESLEREVQQKIIVKYPLRDFAVVIFVITLCIVLLVNVASKI